MSPAVSGGGLDNASRAYSHNPRCSAVAALAMATRSLAFAGRIAAQHPTGISAPVMEEGLPRVGADRTGKGSRVLRQKDVTASMALLTLLEAYHRHPQDILA